MTSRRTAMIAIAAITLVVACEARPRAPVAEPTAVASSDGMGKFRCQVSDGPKSFAMVIDDQADGMQVKTKMTDEWLDRDTELSTDQIHVAVMTDGTRTISVTVDRLNEMSLTVINEEIGVQTTTGQCERI